MATSRRESQINARVNRTVRNMSPVPKPGESGQHGLLRRARSVPSSPDRRSSSSASTAAPSSSNACRPSSSFNPRTASSRSSTSGSASSSSTHGKPTPLHSVSDMAGAKQAAGAVRRRADKSGATSVWPHALTTTPGASSKDPPASRAAKSPSSNVQKTKLSTRPGAEKMTTAAAASSSKPRTTTKATTAGAATKIQSAAAPSLMARGHGVAAKRRTGSETSTAPSLQRTTSVPAAAPKAEKKQDVELLMEEFDEMEGISTPSIEEHLQQRLPDPVDVTTYATTEGAPSEPSSTDHKINGDQESITEHTFSEEKHGDLNGGDADAGIDSGVAVVEEAVGDTELKEEIIVNEAESNGAAGEAGVKDEVDETDLNNETGHQMKGAVDETKLNEADSETEPKEAKADEERIMLPAAKKTTTEAVQAWRKDDGRSNNEVTEEERRSKASAMQERRNKVMALVGRFETVMSTRE